MKTAISFALIVALVGSSTPAAAQGSIGRAQGPSAQQATLRLPAPEHAEKAEQVVVTLRDGREIRGAVGKWVDDVGFYVKPSDGPAWLIHPADIIATNAASTGVSRDIPLRRHGLSQVSQLIIVVSAVVAFISLKTAFKPMG